MRIEKFKSTDSVISIGTVNKVLGTIEDIDTILEKHQDNDLYFRIGIRPELA